MKGKSKNGIFLNINEILNLIDERFNYTFEGKKPDDHLIRNETWHKYVDRFFRGINVEDEIVYRDKWKGARKNKRYPSDFVEEVIEFSSELLIKQYNSNRKTMIDIDWVNLNKALMGWKDDEVPKSVYEKRVIITEYQSREKNRYPKITKGDIDKVKTFFIEEIIKDLIDENKLEEDILQWVTNSELIYGYVQPLEMIDDEEGPLGFKVDRKRYLKDSVINDIKYNNNDQT